MKASRPLRILGLLIVVGALGTAAVVTRDRWLPQIHTGTAETPAPQAAPADKPRVLELSAQARKNLAIVSRPVKLQSFWLTVQIPGEIVDRPGLSDRGVAAPAVGAVTQIHAFPGDTIKVGEPLFTLRLFSEYLQSTQSDLFKATRETQLIQEQIERLEGPVKAGAVPEARLIEQKQQLRRQQAAIAAYRQDLLTRGLSPEQIEPITEGQFVSTITVNAPPQTRPRQSTETAERDQHELVDQQDNGLVYEVQELKVELGQQVQAGQVLCTLSNHHALYIAGHAFKQEAPFLELAAQQRRPIEVEFAEDDGTHWPPLDQTFEIRHLANTIDADSRTFDFFIPLTNQSRGYEQDGQTFVVWRFRPGQRVRLHVPVEELQNVIVLPAAAVVREGPEAYVFRQNGDLFDRRPVHVLHEDRLHAVLANDGSVTPGMYLAQSAAASLNRVLKSQAARGDQPGLHVHPDGTVHAAH
jgi:cobalt-zinc-cadmium efflux system membrane fusion protein